MKTENKAEIEVLSNIADELSQSAAVYEKAAKSVNEKIVTEELQSVATVRNEFTNQVVGEINKLGEEPYQVSSSLDLQKNVELTLGDLLVERNVPRILKACVKFDQKLVGLYAANLEHTSLTDEVKIMLNKQYNAFIELHRQFKERIDNYPWFQN
jgi:hypothetical protein